MTSGASRTSVCVSISALYRSILTLIVTRSDIASATNCTDSTMPCAYVINTESVPIIITPFTVIIPPYHKTIATAEETTNEVIAINVER